MTSASHSRYLQVGLLLAFAAVVWLNAFGGAFVYDDLNILNAPLPENPRDLAAQLGSGIRPLVQLSFLLDRMLWGEEAAGFHAIGIALHFGCMLLVRAMVARIVPTRPAVAFWTALLFLVHPIATESVTYVSGRATAAMAFFYLGAMNFYLRDRRGWALASFVAALLCKEIAITLPLALWLVDRWGAPAPRKASLRRHLPFWAVLAAYLAAAALHPRYAYLLEASLAVRPVLDNLAAQVNALAYALLLFADPRRLSLVHDLAVVTSFGDPRTLGSLAVLAALPAAALARGGRLEKLGVLWFFLQLLPAHSVLPRFELLSERNLYLAAPGLFLALASVGCRLAGRLRPSARRLATAGALALVAALGGATVSRNALYGDPVAFWADAAAKSPASSPARANLGYVRYAEGDLDGAIADFRAALALDRHNAVAHANLIAAWRLRAQAR